MIESVLMKKVIGHNMSYILLRNWRDLRDLTNLISEGFRHLERFK